MRYIDMVKYVILSLVVMYGGQHFGCHLGNKTADELVELIIVDQPPVIMFCEEIPNQAFCDIEVLVEQRRGFGLYEFVQDALPFFQDIAHVIFDNLSILILRYGADDHAKTIDRKSVV